MRAWPGPCSMAPRVWGESVMLIFALLGILATAAHAQLPMDVPPAAGVYVNSEGAPLLPLLKNARDSIDIEIYTMGDKTVRTLLREAISRGVKVRIIKDPNPLGERCNLFAADTGLSADASASDCADQRKLVADVRAAGGSFEPFNKKALCPNGGGSGGQGCYEHGKIALVDGLALVSTGNFDATNLCIAADNPGKCNRDYTLILDDPSIARTLKDLFEADLRGTSYDVRSLIPAELADVLTVSPDSLAPLVGFIGSARESIEIETQYLKEPQINAALIAAARNGVRVSITVASVCSFGSPSPKEAQLIRSTYSTFDQAGISTRMFTASNLVNGKPGYMHAKVIVVDGKRAWLGSENGSVTSLTQNREYGVIFDTSEWVRTVLDTASADHASPGAETWQESLVCAKDGGGRVSSPANPDPVPSAPPPAPKPRKKTPKPRP
jgi:cardiolipin synthase